MVRFVRIGGLDLALDWNELLQKGFRAVCKVLLGRAAKLPPQNMYRRFREEIDCY